jgi:hypothetical protein
LTLQLFAMAAFSLLLRSSKSSEFAGEKIGFRRDKAALTQRQKFPFTSSAAAKKRGLLLTRFLACL